MSPDGVIVLRPHAIPCPACGATLRYGSLPEGDGDLSIEHPKPVCRYYSEEAMTKFIEGMIRCELAQAHKPA